MEVLVPTEVLVDQAAELLHGQVNKHGVEAQELQAKEMLAEIAFNLAVLLIQVVAVALVLQVHLLLQTLAVVLVVSEYHLQYLVLLRITVAVAVVLQAPQAQFLVV
jgi:hypothetical protein